MRRRLHPVVLLAAVGLTLITARLGWWQLDRAAEKQALERQRLQQAAQPVHVVRVGGDAQFDLAADPHQFRRAAIERSVAHQRFQRQLGGLGRGEAAAQGHGIGGDGAAAIHHALRRHGAGAARDFPAARPPAGWTNRPLRRHRRVG